MSNCNEKYFTQKSNLIKYFFEWGCKVIKFCNEQTFRYFF